MSSRLAEEYPALAHLLGAYLHQDYSIFGPTLADAVATFARDDGAADVAVTRQEIARFESAHARDLDAALRRLDAGHSHPPGMDAAAFLRWLDRRLAEFCA